MTDTQHADTNDQTEKGTGPSSAIAGVTARAAEDAPEHVADHMKLYPWEVKLLDPADVPEMHDKTPRAFKTEQAAIMAATRWNNEIFDYVVRP